MGVGGLHFHWFLGATFRCTILKMYKDQACKKLSHVQTFHRQRDRLVPITSLSSVPHGSVTPKVIMTLCLNFFWGGQFVILEDQNNTLPLQLNKLQ